jgi:hypothetical protein
MLDSFTQCIPLDRLDQYITAMLAGQTKGRIVVDLGGTAA